MMNEYNFFLSLLNMNELEKFSNFKTNNKFMLLFCEKIEINVHKTLNSAISV